MAEAATQERAPGRAGFWTHRERIGEAARLCRLIRCRPGLSAGELADELNATGGLFDERSYDARYVRRLVVVARWRGGVPVIARPGRRDGGYRIAATPAEVAEYRAQCERMGRRYFGLAGRLARLADVAVGGQAAIADAVASILDDAAAWTGELPEE